MDRLTSPPGDQDGTKRVSVEYTNAVGCSCPMFWETLGSDDESTRRKARNFQAQIEMQVQS